MKKKLLLPTDFSKNAWNALKYASELYKNEIVDFHLLHAFSVNYYNLENMMVPEPGEIWYEKAKGKAEQEMEKLQRHIDVLEVPSNHTYFTHTVFNSPLEAVIEFVDEKDMDMVIVSTKGETDNRDTVMGTNSIDFMEFVRNCPVLTLPPNVSFEEPNEIVFPTNYKTHFKRRELAHLYEISKITNAPVRVLYVSKNEELSPEQLEKKALLEEYLDGLEYSFHYLKSNNVKLGLSNFRESRNSEMIAFINKKHGVFESIFNKLLVQELGFNSRVPVLALHALRK